MEGKRSQRKITPSPPVFLKNWELRLTDRKAHSQKGRSFKNLIPSDKCEMLVFQMEHESEMILSNP